MSEAGTLTAIYEAQAKELREQDAEVSRLRDFAGAALRSLDSASAYIAPEGVLHHVDRAREQLRALVGDWPESTMTDDDEESEEHEYGRIEERERWLTELVEEHCRAGSHEFSLVYLVNRMGLGKQFADRLRARFESGE